MRKWNKTRLLPLQTGKNIFFEKKFLVIWKYAQMHQNTFLTTPDVQKYLFWKKNSGCLDVFANASKHVFNHSRLSKISLLIKLFWWSKSMCKCIKTRLKPLQTVKNIFFEKKFLVVWKYAQMHQNTFLTTPDVKKYLF
jgi:hypothetical protein